jgi:hypothetical protein
VPRSKISAQRRLWDRHDVAVRRSDRKRITHPVVGLVELDFDVLATAQGQRLIVYSPAPGSAAVGKLELIAALGRERFDTAPFGTAEPGQTA